MQCYWKALAAIAAGGFLNLAVASSFVLWGPSIQRGSAARREGELSRNTLRMSRKCIVGAPGREWSCARVETWVGTGATLHLGLMEERTAGHTVSRNYLVNWSAGWPFRSFGALAVYDNLDQAPLLSEGELPLPRSIKAEGYAPWQPPGLPMKPIALGFLANTTCFSLAGAFVMFAPGVVRRYVRRWRERCVSCGYDHRGLAGDAKCPECGAVHKT